MSLFDCYMEDCIALTAERTPDGSGGFITAYTEGEHFKAAIVRDTSTEARIAEASGTVEMYTVTTSKAIHLPYHAIFKRVADGKTFRVTSDNAENKTPVCSALNMAQSTAEAWRLTE